jgi:hypothetical protein
MIIKASGRSALIVGAGLLVLLASPVTAATDDGDSASGSKSDSTATVVTHRTFRHASHHRRSYAHRRSHAIASKSDDKEADKKAVIAAAAPDDNKTLSSIPPSIANANAQMLLAGVQLSAAAVIPSGTDAPVAASDNEASTTADGRTLMVAADQLNDADRSLQEGSSTPAQAATTTASPPPAPAAVSTMTNESSIWDQTSLIGKIFIGFGALLTMASAARMFIT